MSEIPYAERYKTYVNALIHFGEQTQMVVALEELAECQQAVCKILRGGEDYRHLAEEIADATIMLEQLCVIFNLHGQVDSFMDAKIRRLDDRLREGKELC